MDEPTYGLEFRRARRERHLTQVAVAAALGVSQSYIAQIEGGRNYPSPAVASRITQLLGLEPPSDDDRRGEIAARFAEPSTGFLSRPEGPRLPIVGVPVPGDEERLVVESRPHGSVPAPPQLENVPGAQALYVRGRSMEPRYYPGELVYINPASPLNPGDFVLALVREPQFGAPIGYVRQYLGEDARHVRLATLNPKRNHAIDRKALVSIAKIVGSGLL
jgi:transcriptional regulator with XRE-family HTH domain